MNPCVIWKRAWQVNQINNLGVNWLAWGICFWRGVGGVAILYIDFEAYDYHVLHPNLIISKLLNYTKNPIHDLGLSLGKFNKI
jgi:hypothetical protein